MSDALDVLYDAGGSTEPDPRFRAALLARVRTALAEPGVSLPERLDEVPGAEQTTLDRDYVERSEPAPERRHDRPRARWLRPLVAAAAVAALVLLVVLVAGLAGDDASPPVPVTDPAPTTAAPKAAPTTVEDWVCPNPVGDYVNFCRGSLDAGVHKSWAFKPSLTFRVPGGWSNLIDKTGNYLLLAPGSDWFGYEAGTSDSVMVHASVAAPAGCREFPDRAVATSVQAYVEWLQQQAPLVVSDPVPVTVGGLPGTQVDVALAPGSACTDPDGTNPRAPLFIGTNASIRAEFVTPDVSQRLLLFDRPDGTLMAIAIGDALGAGAADWWDQAGSVVDSFQFEP